MKILLAASESVPFCKTGGLADVVGALAQKLGAAGHDVCLFLPKYRAVEAAPLQSGRPQPLRIPVGGESLVAGLRYMQWRSVSAYFIDYPPFFDREGLYGSEGKDHGDNDRRFVLFARGVLEGAKAIGFKPDVVHCHDWQAGLIPAYLKRHYASDPFYAGAATLMTVHNMAYQGNFPRTALAAAGFGDRDFTPDLLEYYGQVSYLKAGLVFADLLSTVSPTYAREIQESGDRGFGLEGLLRRRSAELFGVLNGIDTDSWNPERDGSLPMRYGAEDVAKGKAACRQELARECGLGEGDGKPLIGVVSRLDYQKGLDLAAQALEPRLDRCRFAVVGVGDPSLHESLSALARRHPRDVHFHTGFDDAFARRVYAASDFFLMPSRFEPCGLGQMIAMRYGAIPIVSRTGGLADTVFESARDGRAPNGFLAAPGDAADLGRALDRALGASARERSELVRSGLSTPCSWDGPVARYVELYGRAAALRLPSR